MGVFVVIGAVFMFIGCVFALTGSVGVLRMPDFYSRLHPAGKSDTLAQVMIMLGLAMFAGQQLVDSLMAEDHGGHGGGDWVGIANIILKLLLLSSLLFLTAPTSTHAISKAARIDKHTRLPVENDAGGSRIAEIVVVGDVHTPLAEPAGPVLDVRERDDDEFSSDAPPTLDDGPNPSTRPTTDDGEDD